MKRKKNPDLQIPKSNIDIHAENLKEPQNRAKHDIQNDLNEKKKKIKEERRRYLP